MACTDSSKHIQSLIQYITTNNPDGITSFLSHYGKKTTFNNISEIYPEVLSIVKDRGLESIEKLYSYHPDREAILELNKAKESNISFQAIEKANVKPSVSLDDLRSIYSKNDFWHSNQFQTIALIVILVIVVIALRK
ncbi:hypothetical protein MYP_656 [Sporocytophaga myxococcoides]|uniref:Uncharacterized protein n=1 Tax=Sporocytophaga myxococcoides TaxID=153721 RepID=A0A098LAG9_9BACT|nr:hypothetical protein [Sporocytophaga myxococcoides]GAL83429.1 hypothetical protein MYP_656 [Sporocytophaga myxococcoides]